MTYRRGGVGGTEASVSRLLGIGRGRGKEGSGMSPSIVRGGGARAAVEEEEEARFPARTCRPSGGEWRGRSYVGA